MALAHCILGKFLGVGCHCFPPPLDVPTFSARCLHVQRRERPLAAESETLRGRQMFRQIQSRIRFPRNSRDLLHAANLRHGTDDFTASPKEGVLRIFSHLKIRRLRPGLNPANLGTKGQHATARPPKPIVSCYTEEMWFIQQQTRRHGFHVERYEIRRIIISLAFQEEFVSDANCIIDSRKRFSIPNTNRSSISQKVTNALLDIVAYDFENREVKVPA